MEVKRAACPIGAKCEEVKTDKEGEQVLYRCPWYAHIRGKDPQGEDTLDHWECAVAWLPTLLIENAQMTRQTGAAIEDFRNVMSRDNQKVLALARQGSVKELE